LSCSKALEAVNKGRLLQCSGLCRGFLRVITVVFLMTTNLGVSSWGVKNAGASPIQQVSVSQSSIKMGGMACCMMRGKCHMLHCSCCKTMKNAQGQPNPDPSGSVCTCGIHSENTVGLYICSFRDIQFTHQFSDVSLLSDSLLNYVTGTISPCSILLNIPSPPPRSVSIFA
jgi:hypothetical protein